jgi:hypothetical protein
MIDRCLNAAITSFEIFFRPLSSWVKILGSSPSFFFSSLLDLTGCWSRSWSAKVSSSDRLEAWRPHVLWRSRIRWIYWCSWKTCLIGAW